MFTFKCSQSVFEQEQTYPGHNRVVVRHGPVNAMFVPIVFPLLSLCGQRDLIETEPELIQQLLIFRLPYHRHKLVNCTAYQSIGWSVSAEFIVSHIEPSTISNIYTQVLREQETAFQTD